MGMLLTEWVLNLVDMTKNLGPAAPGVDDDSGAIIVLTAGSPTSPSVYTDRYGTALATTGGLARLAFTNGVARFYTAQSVTSIDVTGITASGHAIGISGLAANSKHVEHVYRSGVGRHVLAVPFGASDNAETDTGLDLPANCLMNAMSVKLRVTSTDATETIDFGLLSSESGGDANGFITARSVANSGFVELLPQITGGTNIDYVGTRYVGDLLATSIPGADAVATVGGFTSKVYRTDGTAKSLTYTGSAGSDTAAGYFYLMYDKLPF